MATTSNTLKLKTKPRSPILILLVFLSVIAFLCMFSSLLSINGFSFSSSSFSFRNLKRPRSERQHSLQEKYLYWGNRIDCPGKICEPCAGLGHQESSLRWADNSCAIESLYNVDLLSETVPVILDDSKMWYWVLMTSMQLGARGVAHVEGISRANLRDDTRYSDLLLINQTANPLSWFVECKDRKNKSAILLPHSFLPSMAAEKLRDAAEQIKALLGDYDAMHVRRGDILKTRKDKNGVERTLHPHLDRDTRPEFILCRIKEWVPPGRTLFIASNERTPGFFSPLSVRYKLAYSSNFSQILDPVIENNYQLFMVERLVLAGAKTYIKTYKEDDIDLSLTDDPKKNTKNWQIPVYTLDRDQEC